ncbi:MAG: aldo/keto reductase [Firmicutes bacterium]|nr:aldo/keto reductase [Bacillota bacterium]
MRKIELGKSDLQISVMGLGCMGMSEFYGTADADESIRAIHKALDSGVNFIDTADMYGLGANEELVGKALKGRREQVVLATKFGVVRSANPMERAICGKPEYVKQACENSLRRLGVDVIDLYYQHRVDPDTPIEETVGAMAELVREGKIRYIGLSEAAPEVIERADKVHPVSALQTEFSLWSREPEDDLLPLCKKLGITFVAYSPLGRGFLTGRFRSIDDFKANDYRRFSPRFMGDNFNKNLELVEEIKTLASEKGCTPSQLALAWVMSRENTVPIPGTTNLKHLEENIGAAAIELTAGDLARIDRIAPAGAAHGERYPKDYMPTTYRS